MGRGALAPQRSAPAFFCLLQINGNFQRNLEVRQSTPRLLGSGLWCVAPWSRKKSGRRELAAARFAQGGTRWWVVRLNYLVGWIVVVSAARVGFVAEGTSGNRNGRQNKPDR